MKMVGLSAKQKAGMPLASQIRKENVKDTCHLKRLCYLSGRMQCLHVSILSISEVLVLVLVLFLFRVIVEIF